MKKNFIFLTAAILLSLTLAGCDPRPSDVTTSGGTAGSSKVIPASTGVSTAPADAILNNDPVAGTLDEVKTLAYESRSTLTEISDKMDRQINALMAQWVASGRQFPSETKAQLSNSRRVLTEKLNALTFATPETWNTAKDEATTALQNVRGALHAMDTSTK